MVDALMIVAMVGWTSEVTPYRSKNEFETGVGKKD
jgi:hypothetical protein